MKGEMKKLILWICMDVKERDLRVLKGWKFLALEVVKIALEEVKKKCSGSSKKIAPDKVKFENDSKNSLFNFFSSLTWKSQLKAISRILLKRIFSKKNQL